MKHVLQTISFAALLLTFFASMQARATVYYSKSTATNFNTLSQWGENTDGTGTAPTAISNTHDFVVANGAAITTSATASVRRLTVSAGCSLTVSHLITVQTSGNNGQFNLNGTLIFNTAITASAGSTWASTLFRGATTIASSSVFIVQSIGTAPSTGTGLLAVSIASNSWGSFIWRTNSFGSTGLNLTMPSGTTFNGKFQMNQTGTRSNTIVRLSGSTGSQNFTFKDDFDIANGSFEMTNSGSGNSYNFEKGFLVSSTSVFANGTGNISTYNFNGSDCQWTVNSYGTNSTNIVVASTAKLTLNTNLAVQTSRTLTVNGILDAKTAVISGVGGFTLASTGTMISANTGGFRTSGSIGSVQVSGTRTWNTAAKYTLNSAAANQAAGFATHPTTSGDVLMSNLTISNGGSFVVSLDADVLVSGPVTVSADANLRTDDGFNVKKGTGGTVVLNGTLQSGDDDGFAGGASAGTNLSGYDVVDITIGSSSTVNYRGGTQVVTSYTTYNNLSITTSSTKSSDGDITVAGTLTVSAGTFNFSDDDITVSTGLASGGTLADNSSSRFIIGGSTGAMNWPFASTLAGGLSINRTGGLSLGANLTVGSVTALTSGGITLNSQTLTLNGQITGTNAITGSTTAGLTIGGTGTISAFATPTQLATLSVSPTAARTLALSQGLTLGTSLTIGANGTLSVGNNTLNLDGTFTATAGASLTLGSTSGVLGITRSGPPLSFPAAITAITNGTVSVSRRNGLFLNANLAVNNLSFAGGGLDLSGDKLTINGNFNSSSGVFTGSNTSQLEILGTGTLTSALTFDQSGNNGSLNQLTINRTSGVVTLGSNLSIAGGSNLLRITAGTLNASTFTLGGGSSNLTMTGGTLQLGKLLTTLPEIDGTITLSSGSTIELNGAGNQTVRGARNYQNLTLSGGGTKSFSSAITTANKIFGTLTIAGATTIVDVANTATGGNYDDATATNFTMTGGEYRTSNLSLTVPVMSGTYNITGGKIILYGTTGTQSQSLRGGRTYHNVDITATAANYRTGTDQAGNVIQGSGAITITGTFAVKSPAVFATGTDNINGAGTFTIEDGAGLVYGSADGITSSGATGNVRTTTRSFSANAYYGVRGSTGSIVTGNGLPGSVLGFIAGKSTGSLTFSSPCTVNNNFYLSGGTVAGTNLSIANTALITRTGGSFSSAPTFGAGVNILYAQTGSAITTGPEIPSATSVLNNLEVNSSNGVIGGGSFTVNGNVTFTLGHFNTNGNTVTLGSTSTLVGETSTKYLKGISRTTRSVGTGSGTFGNLGYEIASGSDDLGTVTVIRKAGSGYNLTGLGNQSISRHYDVSQTGSQPSSGRDITLRWTSDEDNGKNFGASNAAIFRRDNSSSPWMRLRLGNKWMPVTIAGTMRSLLTRTYHFSDYTVTDQNAPLPVVLSVFDGEAKPTGAILTWSTEQEVNNHGFLVERSWDGDRFDSIAFVKGKGTTAAKQMYETVDLGFKQLAYYRLVQQDLDGQREVFKTIVIKATGYARPILSVYPNPAISQVIIKLDQPSQLANITVQDAVGKTVYEGKDQTLMVSSWPKGMYQVTANYKDGSQDIQKLIVQ